MHVGWLRFLKKKRVGTVFAVISPFRYINSQKNPLDTSSTQDLWHFVLSRGCACVENVLNSKGGWECANTAYVIWVSGSLDTSHCWASEKPKPQLTVHISYCSLTLILLAWNVWSSRKLSTPSLAFPYTLFKDSLKSLQEKVNEL